jgi:hypothetical protein
LKMISLLIFEWEYHVKFFYYDMLFYSLKKYVWEWEYTVVYFVMIKIFIKACYSIL